ncbi:hypothetical protein JOQ06_020348 [Pogonophryne albipinna]|uniref:Interferon-induced very large GTPase 1-like n=1 Tax=Pogonophryne albipinna TaxID=1090488 RepID=A0AAD6BSS2_9TELE|nr:hypothetical protein JOQ06_020348 [Pogonophryne albipinna]
MMTDKMKRKSNHHDTYIEEILNMIDERLENNQEVATDITFEVSLKQHICADAARRFQKRHEDFIQKKDPYRCLNKNKGKFLADFKDVFHDVDQCQKKAEEFTDHCLKPAVEHFVNRSLGPDIIGEMRTKKFKKTNIQTKLQSLHVNPQDELFNKLIGCGEQCPFCKAPCEAGGRAHTEHFTSLHRPQGLGTYRRSNTEKLCIDICSSLVNSDIYFHCSDSNDDWHPFKRYKEIYPDWNIPPDASLQASDYWKYVLAKFNDEFVAAYDAKPADIPDAWKRITPEQAEASLKESFHI